MSNCLICAYVCLILHNNSTGQVPELKFKTIKLQSWNWTVIEKVTVLELVATGLQIIANENWNNTSKQITFKEIHHKPIILSQN